VVPLQLGIAGGLAVLIVGLFVLVIPSMLAYWVYTDAKSRGDDRPALWALSVGGLTVLTFFGGLLALVVYIRQRN
jgi:hypothetical protein